jgi:1,4-dihydroxy-2-naphthoate octaprenyltransferase
MNNLKTRISKVLQIIRLHIVLGGALAFSLGVLLAASQGGIVKLEVILTGYAVVFLGDLSTHFSNDFFDVEVDKEVKRNSFFAGKKILAKNPDLLLLSRNISIVLFISSTLLAILDVVFLYAPADLFLLMLFASLLGWFYSAPPIRFVSRGVGEFIVAYVTGFVIPGVGYLSVRGQFDPLFFYFSIPFMMYGLILSLSLHLPDTNIDEKNGKNTFAVRNGKKASVRLIIIAALLASLTFFALLLGRIPSSLNLFVIFVFSAVTLLTVVLGYLRFWTKNNVTSFASSNIVSLFLLNVFLIAYLAYVVLVG